MSVWCWGLAKVSHVRGSPARSALCTPTGLRVWQEVTNAGGPSGITQVPTTRCEQLWEVSVMGTRAHAFPELLPTKRCPHTPRPSLPALTHLSHKDEVSVDIWGGSPASLQVRAAPPNT